MLDELYVNGMIEIIYRDTAIARVFPYPGNVYVKILSTGYEFSCDSLTTAKQLIKLKMGL